MAQSEKYGIFLATAEIELYEPLLRAELYLRWKKNLNLTFHKILKRDSEQTPKIDIFEIEKFVDKRSELLRKLNIVDHSREFLECSLHFQS